MAGEPVGAFKGIGVTMVEADKLRYGPEGYPESAIAENLRQLCPVAPGRFPRPIELRAKATFEPEQLRTFRFIVGSGLIRLGVRVLGWRADYYLWDSRGPSMAAPHPCPCHYTRRVEEGGS